MTLATAATNQIQTLLRKEAPRRPALAEIPPLSLRSPLLSPGQMAVYLVLLAVVGKRVTVCPKVRLTDVFAVQYKPKDPFYHRLASRSVDFLLCEKYTLRPLMAIEAYDHSLPRDQQKQRDPVLDQVFKKGRLPLLHLKAQRYAPKALARWIAPYLTTVVYTRNTPPTELAFPPRCPHCGVRMVKRRIISGDYEGREYYSCPNYPQCRSRRPISDAVPYLN